MLNLSKALVTLGMVVYTTPVAAWLLLRVWKGEAWPRVGMMNAAGAVWFIPLLVLLPLALLVRARQASVMGLLLLLPALWLFGSEWLPPLRRSAPTDTPQLRVLTFNALVSNGAYDEAVALVLEQQPDVFAVQELSQGMADALNAQVGAAYPYQLLAPWSDPRGIGLWSRLPLAEGPTFDHPNWPAWAQTATVEVGGRRVQLVNVHLWPIGTLDERRFTRGLALQHQQVATLVTLLRGSPDPVLLFGDCNASPTNETYGMLAEVAEDAWRGVGFGAGFTFPAPETSGLFSRPFLRIDYFWTRGPLVPTRVEVLAPAGSDHLPMVGEFMLTD